MPSSDQFTSFVGDLTGVRYCVDFAVDLKEVFKDAAVKKADALQVCADVVRIPQGYTIELGEKPYRLDVVARHLEIENGQRAVLNLRDHSSHTAATSARLLVGEMTGDLHVRLRSAGPEAEPTELYPSGALQYSTFTLQRGTGNLPGPESLLQAKTKLPLDMLAKDKRLYRLLEGSFELVAGLTAEIPLNGPKLELARSILDWLTRWSAYPSAALIPLFQSALSLEGVLPTLVRDPGPSLVYVVPSYTPKDYFKFAETQLESAKAYHLDASFSNLGDQIENAVGLIVETWHRRDGVDLQELGTRIDEAKARVRKALSAVKSAGEDIKKQSFANTLFQIDLETEQKIATIKAMFKAAFELVMAVVEIGTAVATGMANLAAPSLDPRPGLKLIASAQNVSLADKVKGVAAVLYQAWPKELASALWDMDSKSRKNLGKFGKDLIGSVMDAGSGFEILYNGAHRFLKHTGEITILGPNLNVDGQDPNADFGEIVSTLSNMMDPPETKAAWDAFLAEAKSQFDLVIGDQDTPVEVKQAAVKYKVGVEKLAIYGRMLSERQAILAQEVRELGSLILSKASVQQKQGQLGPLKTNLAQPADAKKALQAESDSRLRELGRTFFTTLWGFRSALFYDAMKWEIPSLTIPTDRSKMQELHDAMERALIHLGKVKRGELKVTLKVKSEEVLNSLKNYREAKIPIELKNSDFKGQDLVLIEKVSVTLVGVPKTKSIELTMTSETLMNRSGQSEYTFADEPAEIKYMYGGSRSYQAAALYIQPTPFSTWTLRIDNGDELDLGGLSEVELELVCRTRPS